MKIKNPLRTCVLVSLAVGAVIGAVWGFVAAAKQTSGSNVYGYQSYSSGQQVGMTLAGALIGLFIGAVIGVILGFACGVLLKRKLASGTNVNSTARSQPSAQLNYGPDTLSRDTSQNPSLRQPPPAQQTYGNQRANDSAENR